MQEVGHELQAIRQAHEEAMEAQRHGFNVEIEMVKERLRQEEMQIFVGGQLSKAEY